MTTTLQVKAVASLLMAAWALTAVDAVAASIIPLCPGLQIVTAVSQAGGDYESIKTIQSVSDTEIKLRYSAEVRSSDLFSVGSELKTLTVNRIMLTKDLQSATDYVQVYMEKSDEKIPGTTSIGTSAAVLRNLKTKGISPFGYSNAYGGLTLSSDRSKYPNYYSYLQRGTLRRVPGAGTLAVIVNDVSVNLPVVRAEGALYGDKVEFSFLDDPTNPLTLAFRIGIDGIKPLTREQLDFCAAVAKSSSPISTGPLHCDKPKGGDRDVLRVIKIASPCAVALPAAGGGDGGLEQALANQQKVDIYSIYFSYNSDALRDESAPAIKAIADILTRHTDWRLAVNGHTDGIGSDEYNNDLSKRRAAAVVNALVTQYHIGAGRLKSAGFGKSQPKDTNDTLEGRARNRRVELMRF